ncbi:MAG TPA: hypothetical protein VLY21_00200 [Nitrososphaerales archaeon]|nr:hypothetical protein [Nitrososphaerales archaeon]
MGFFGNRRKRAPPAEADAAKVLDHRTSDSTVTVAAKFEGKIWRELSSFLKEKGVAKYSDGISLLFAYGVTEREGIDLEKRRSELMALGSRYAAMRFKTYTLFDQNRALSIALAVMLTENKELRRRAAERGLIPHTTEPWDGWTHETVSEFHGRYLFVG